MTGFESVNDVVRAYPNNRGEGGLVLFFSTRKARAFGIEAGDLFDVKLEPGGRIRLIRVELAGEGRQ